MEIQPHVVVLAPEMPAPGRRFPPDWLRCLLHGRCPVCRSLTIEPNEKAGNVADCHSETVLSSRNLLFVRSKNRSLRDDVGQFLSRRIVTGSEVSAPIQPG